MKIMTVREGSRGREKRVKAKRTYRADSGDWVVEVDKAEFSKACTYVCQDVENCIWENLQVQADQDDDGKEYKVLTK